MIKHVYKNRLLLSITYDIISKQPSFLCDNSQIDLSTKNWSLKVNKDAVFVGDKYSLYNIYNTIDRLAK